MEMHRIAQRQFHWQHGYYNLPQLYRYSYIYGQGKCGEYFERTYGIPIADLTFVGFALYASHQRTPWLKQPLGVPELELSADLVKRAMPLLALSTENARTRSVAINAQRRNRTAAPFRLLTCQMFCANFRSSRPTRTSFTLSRRSRKCCKSSEGC